MDWAFYIAALVAVLATVLVITGKNAVHALLCLILSSLAVAVLLFLFGAPFAAALEVIIYAGAIMVLFVFAVMLLSLGRQAEAAEAARLGWTSWLVPLALGAVLLVEMAYVVLSGSLAAGELQMIAPKEVGRALFGAYLLPVEMAALLLLAGLLGAYHLGRQRVSTGVSAKPKGGEQNE